MPAQVRKVGPVQVAAAPFCPALVGFGFLWLLGRFFFRFRDEPRVLGQVFFSKSNLGNRFYIQYP
jgi:hypothetical protein